MSANIALVHDYFVEMGGAERVAEALSYLFPQAPIYTTVALRERLTPRLRAAEMHTSWMQHLPAHARNRRCYFPLYPHAVESLDLSAYDLIISSSSGYAKGVRRRKGAVHVCYCHTPMRWVWRYEDYAARENFGRLTRMALPLLLANLRRWDERAASQPDFYIANSHTVARRIKAAYGRSAVVIPPPIDTERFDRVEADEDYYLVLSRLVPYKRLDIAVEACTRTNRPLVVIGDGPDRRRLEQIAGSNVRFLGRQPDDVVARYAASCRALLFPGEEDFGMVPLEVNAAGRPVIAYRAGGATETIIEEVTGLFFDEPTSESLALALERFENCRWNQNALRSHARKFDHASFASRLLSFLHTVAPSRCAQEDALPSAPLVLREEGA